MMEFDRTIDYYCRDCCLCVVGCFNFIALLLVFINNPYLDLQISSRFLVSLSLSRSTNFVLSIRSQSHLSLYILYFVLLLFVLLHYMYITCASNSSPFYFVLFSFLPRQGEKDCIGFLVGTLAFWGPKLDCQGLWLPIDL